MVVSCVKQQLTFCGSDRLHDNEMLQSCILNFGYGLPKNGTAVFLNIYQMIAFVCNLSMQHFKAIDDLMRSGGTLLSLDSQRVVSRERSLLCPTSATRDKLHF